MIVDGVDWGNAPSPELADLGVAQSCRAYTPFHLTRYKAHWAGNQQWVEPHWPFEEPWGARKLWDKSALEAHYAKWAALIEQGTTRLAAILPSGARGTDLECRQCRRFHPHIRHTRHSLYVLRIQRLAAAVLRA